MASPSRDALIRALSTNWVDQHSPIHKDKLHAIGYISVVWNAAEHISHIMFGSVLQINASISQIISKDMGDKTLWDKYLSIAKVSGYTEKSLDLITAASKHYDHCRQNRNSILHAGMNGIPAKLVRRQGMQFGAELDDSIENLRRVALDIRACVNLLAATYVYLQDERLGKPTTWPEIPPLPELLVKPPPKTPKPPRQRKASPTK